MSQHATIPPKKQRHVESPPAPAVEPQPVPVALPTPAMAGHTFADIAITADAATASQPMVQREPAVPVQREGFQLSPPTLFQPPDPAARYHLGGDLQLHLDPQLEAMMQQQLHSDAVLPSLAQINLNVPAASAAAAPPAGASSAATAPTPAAPASSAAAPSAPTPPNSEPKDAQPKNGSAGDVLKAVAALPQVKIAWENLQTTMISQVKMDWGKLRTGEKAGVISTVSVIALGGIAGLATDPAARQTVFDQLNGKTIPVPGLDWLAVETNITGENMMFGLHLDVGRFLPSVLNFGPGDPKAIGGPPQPEPLPGQRRAADDATPSNDALIGERIRAAAGRGATLESTTKGWLETGLHADLSPVRLHTDTEADQLSRSLGATAFTTGPDIFFRSGAYNPGTSEGQQLLAHETTHTVQQASGPVAGTPTAGGVALSDPTDKDEQAAERTADVLVQRQTRDDYILAPELKQVAEQSISTTNVAIQRFSAGEHQQIGTQASEGAQLDIDLGNGEKLAYGDMVVMADFFGSVTDIRHLATTPAGQAELRWTRWFALHQGSEPAVDETVKARVRDRFWRLSANNIAHFSAGGTARNEYERLHQQALFAAFSAGVTGNGAKWSEAMISEAFGNHFLTDMFSAGHVRTPRAEMKTWYEQQYPDSVGRFVSFTSDWITNNLASRGDIPLWLPNSIVKARIERQVRALGGSAVDSFSIADIVSLAFHDHDNAGLGVISDVDPSGTSVSGGFHWTSRGDNHLATGENGTDENPLSRASITRQMTVAAVRESLNDLSLAKEQGLRAGSGQSLSETQFNAAWCTALASLQPFAAEQYIPREDPDAGNVQMNWHWGQLDDTLRAAVDHEVKTTIAGTLRGRSGSVCAPDGIFHIRMPAEWLPGLGPDMAGGDIPLADLHVRDAFVQYCDHLGAQGIQVLEQALAAAAQPAADDATFQEVDGGQGGARDAGGGRSTGPDTRNAH